MMLTMQIVTSGRHYNIALMHLEPRVPPQLNIPTLMLQESYTKVYSKNEQANIHRII